MADRPLQPLLHELVSVTLAPATALSDPDGQIRPGGVRGVFHADVRVLCRAELRVDGREPEALRHGGDGPHGVRFVSLARWLGDPGPDPTVRIDRVRRLVPRGMVEEIHLVSTADQPVSATVTLDLGCDLAPIETVKTGGVTPPLSVRGTGDGTLTWQAAGITVTASGPDTAGDGDGGADDSGADDSGRFTWAVALPPRGRTVLRWELHIEDPNAVVVVPAGAPDWPRPRARADDRRIVRLLERSLDDLAGLRLAEANAPHEVFLGAGVPWFLTLFGRDSLWAARMLLPLGTELAGSTLRVLARRQGIRRDDRSGEAPGKIMHELRRHEFLPGQGLRLPAAYYGTVDATLLWVLLLHDAWRWGLPDDEVAPLLPHLTAALGWLDQHADADGDGFVEYLDTSGTGLANQGWKDSFDAVRFHDGTLAPPPIALAEVQGYAHAAATCGATLLDAFGQPGGDRWRAYASALADRFRARFWVDGLAGAYPALALDRDKRPVNSLTSNIGHLLGTGLLNAAESARVADLLADPAMSGGFGLRTMSRSDAGFSPLSYHCGSVWAHDTAIAIAGLAAEGHATAAARLVDGLLGAAEAFDYRLPELFSGDDRQTLGQAIPYPAACRPQAWSAAAAVVLLQAAVGLYPDVPAGRVRLRPLPGAPLGAVAASGLRIAGVPVDAAVDQSGVATVTGLPGGLTVAAERPTPERAGTGYRVPTQPAPGDSVQQGVQADGEARTAHD